MVQIAVFGLQVTRSSEPKRAGPEAPFYNRFKKNLFCDGFLTNQGLGTKRSGSPSVPQVCLGWDQNLL